MGRRWILCDESPLATAAAVTRLADLQKEMQEADGDEPGFDVEAAKDAPEGMLSAKDIPAGELAVNVTGNHLELMRYEPPETVLRCSAPEEVKRFIKGDSLSLIGMWSVDFAWDGQVHRAGKILCSGERSVEIPEGAENIHIAGYDVFGSRFAVSVEQSSYTTIS